MSQRIRAAGDQVYRRVTVAPDTGAAPSPGDILVTEGGDAITTEGGDKLETE